MKKRMNETILEFYREEIREGYPVTEKLKHIWKIELDILQEILRICNKYKIHYIAYGGTLIGGVRHKGFIPWDDDLDIAMLRDDYEIFLEKAEKELDVKKFCLQRSEIAGEIYEGFARIRHNHSTAIIERDRNKKCNHGIFIDIFPLDEIPEGKMARMIQFKEIKFLSALLYYHTYRGNSLEGGIKGLLVGFIKRQKTWDKIADQVKKICMKYNGRGGEKVGILSCDPYDEKCWWYLEDITDTIETEFEYIRICIPRNYDRCLTIGYGDYMEFPPEEERGKWHGDKIFFDPYEPFAKYIE